MILCLAGALWLKALRIERSSRAFVELAKRNLKISKGSRDGQRMRLRDLQKETQRGWQRRDGDNRFRPSPPDASQKGRIEKVQQAIRKRREALLRAYNGGRK